MNWPGLGNGLGNGPARGWSGEEQGPKGNGHTFESCWVEPRGSTGSLADAIRVPFALRFVPNPRP